MIPTIHKSAGGSSSTSTEDSFPTPSIFAEDRRAYGSTDSHPSYRGIPSWWFLLLVVVSSMLLGMSLPLRNPPTEADHKRSFERRDEVLNQLSAAINAEYGFRRNVPRINQGPCAPFALEFAMAWNNRFEVPVRLSYVLTKEEKVNVHVAVRLPDGRYFDGGNGVLTKADLTSIYSNTIVEDRADFDLGLLNYRAGGLFGNYDRCPNYDHRTTRHLIISHLDLLKLDAR